MRQIATIAADESVTASESGGVHVKVDDEMDGETWVTIFVRPGLGRDTRGSYVKFKSKGGA